MIPPACTRRRKRPGKVRRSKADIERDRRELIARTESEIDALLAEHHKRLPRNLAKAIGAAYARYSTRFQHSIADQLRSLLEAAERLGVFIPRELVFYDIGVRGFKNRRPGLDALRAANAERRFAVFLAFATNRLFRKTYRALQFVEENLAGRGIRCIFVKNNIDTASGDRWRTLLSIFCSLDEDAVGVYADNVRAAHEGLFDRKMVIGCLPIGFRGEDVPGLVTKRNRPAQKIAVDEEAAEYVRRIFRWFAEDGLSINEIARRLNDDENAPAPAKSQTGLWTHELVRAHLMRPCYRGHGEYGRRKSTWSSTKDYAVLVPREKPLKTAQWDDLRLVGCRNGLLRFWRGCMLEWSILAWDRRLCVSVGNL